MNVLTIGAAFGVLVLVFQEGVGVEGLEQTQPVLLAATVFGLSTDYAVFLLSGSRRHTTGGSRTSQPSPGGSSGRAASSPRPRSSSVSPSARLRRRGLVFVQELGVGTAVAVALDATVVRALLVPSLMAILGEWNWWAPAPLRRLHRRLL